MKDFNAKNQHAYNNVDGVGLEQIPRLKGQNPTSLVGQGASMIAPIRIISALNHIQRGMVTVLCAGLSMVIVSRL
jgi:hypothetical protein